MDSLCLLESSNLDLETTLKLAKSPLLQASPHVHLIHGHTLPWGQSPKYLSHLQISEHSSFGHSILMEWGCREWSSWMTWAPLTPSSVPGLSLLEGFQPGEPGDNLSHPKGLDASPGNLQHELGRKALFTDVGARLGPSLKGLWSFFSPHVIGEKTQQK